MTTDEHQGSPPDFQGVDTDKSFANDAVRGSAWGFFQTVVSKILAIVIQLILARVLFPSDFGLVAIAVGTAAIFTFFSPLPIVDLLVQRGPRIGNAIVNAWRLCILCAIVIGVLIAASSLVVSMRPGQPITTFHGGQATGNTSLAEIKTVPPLPILLENVHGTFELWADDRWVEVSLPEVPAPETSIDAFAELLQDQIDRAIGDKKTNVVFNTESARLQIMATDGSKLSIRSNSTREGSVLDSLGVEYQSLPLIVLLLILAIRPLLIALRVPYAAVMRLKLRFGQIAGVNLIANGSGHMSAIALALLGAGPIALMAPQIIYPILAAIFMYFLVRPLTTVPKKERERKRTIASDSAYLWGAQWIHTTTLQAPYLILGIFVSSLEVGYYYFAFLLSVQIILLLSHNVSAALTPIFSNLQGERDRLASAFLRSVGAISGISIPLFIGAAASAAVFVPILFSERWTPSVPILVVLLVSQAFASTNLASGSLLKGTGRYRAWFTLQIVQGTLVLTAVAIASWLGGAIAVAWTILGQQVVFAPLMLYLCVRGHARKRVVARIHGLPIVACLPMVPVGLVLGAMGPTLIALLLWTPILLVTAAVAYVLCMRVLDRERYDEISEIVFKITSKLARMIGRGRSDAK
jgi:O-antigen/teichoic acid export membrane protein